MNGINYVLFFAVAIEILWIVTSAMRKKEEEQEQQRRPRPDPFDRPRQRTMPTNVDRFLEEINRRRQEAAQRQGATLQDRIDDAVTRRRQETGSSFPAAQPKPRPLSPLPELPTRRVQVPSVPPPVVRNPPVVPVIRDVRRISEPVLVVEAVDTPQSAKPASGVTSPAAKATPQAQEDIFAIPQIRRAASPLRDKLIPLVRSRQAAPLAILLNEVFGQPLCKRPRRTYRTAAFQHAPAPDHSDPATRG
jgi:hypothetical protein